MPSPSPASSSTTTSTSSLSPGYFVTDLSLRRPFGDRLAVFLSAENLFDRKVVAARTPLETLGNPRLVQVGVSVRR